MAQLKKEIGPKALLLLSINAILGTGIFFLPAIGASYSGPASLISWIIMAFAAVLISCYFAELVSMFPKAGGVYEFMKQASGKFPSFLIGWTAWIVANITIAMLIVGALYYLLPAASIHTYIFLSLLLIIIFNYISYIGIRHSTKLLLIFGVATLSALLILILSGFFRIEAGNYTPFFVFPISSVFLTIFIIAETFFGWETTTFLAEETKDAKRVLPKTLVTATIIIGLIAISLTFVCLGAVNWKVFAEAKAPLSYLADILFGEFAGKIFAVFMFIPIVGTAAGWIVSSPRLLFAMARDKLFIEGMHKIHKKYKTPYKAIGFQTAATIIITIIALANYRILLSLLVPLVLIVYSAVLFCVFKLRKDKPNIKRYFNAPFPKIGPLVLIAFNICLLAFWLASAENALRIFSIGIIFVALGMPAYAAVRLHHDRKFIEKFWDRAGIWFDIYLPLLIKKKELRKVLRNADLRSGQTVLDYGAGEGRLALHIAKIIKNGKIVAADLSVKQLKRAVRLAEKLEHPNISFVKLSKPAPFDKNMFDRIICTVAINYFVHPEKELKVLHNCLKKNGKVSFLAVLAPTVTSHAFLHKDCLIKNIFKEAGFRNTKVERGKEFGGELIYITGGK